MNNKKASAVDILVFIVISFLTVMFLGLWIYGFGEITDVLTNIKGSEAVNISSAASDTFGRIEPAQKSGAHFLAFALIATSALSILVTNFLVKSHPVFFVVFFFIIIAAFISAVILSNYYEDWITNPTFGPTFQEFGAATFIMLHLPIWVAVIGMFGAVFRFAGILRDRGLGESLV